jgi:lysophospholipase L1-like esterase
MVVATARAMAAFNREGALPAGRIVRWVTALLGLLVAGLAVAMDFLIGGAARFGWLQGAGLLAGLALALCCLLPLRWNRLALLAIGSGAAGLLLVEVCLRLFLSPYLVPSYQFDERYLFELIPNTTKAFRHRPVNGGHTITYRINSKGFRGEELQADGAATRVVVYGDSFVQARYSVLENTFTEQLEARLAARLHRPIEVVNAGVTAYGPDQASLRLEDELAWLAPDLVVVAIFGGNDFGDLVRNKLFRLDAAGRLYVNSYVVDERLKTSLIRTAKAPFTYRVIVRALERRRRSSGDRWKRATAGIPSRGLLEEWLRSGQAAYEEYVVHENDVVTHLFSDHYDADMSLTPTTDSAHYKALLMERVLQRIQRTLRNHGIPLVLLIIPHPMDVQDVYEMARVERARYPDYRRSTITDVLQRTAERHRMRFVNLFEPYRQRRAEVLYFSGGDQHWNDVGQAVAAELIADYVLTEQLLEPEAAREEGRVR